MRADHGGTSRSPRSPEGAIIFSNHTLGFGARKNSVVCLAEGLAEMGWRVDFVTTQVSLLSDLAGVPRLKMIPRRQRNVWIECGDLISSFVWVPPFHPATTPYPSIDRLASPIFRLYPHLLPSTIRDRVRSARLIVIESCSAVLLYPLLKRLAPGAKFVYRACDSLDAVGMHPILKEVEAKTAPHYDLFTSPSHILLEPFPPSVKKCFLPQGLPKSLFDVAVPSPFENGGPNAIIAGDMMFDRETVEIMLRNFPQITFHAFGNMDLEDFDRFENLRRHGEVPFETLRNYTLHADLGVAPYLDRPDVHYLAESSLKLVQYTYARLPILAPNFCKGDRDHLKGYVPGDEASIVEAVQQALAVDRGIIDRSGVRDWQELVELLLSEVGLLSDT